MTNILGSRVWFSNRFCLSDCSVKFTYGLHLSQDTILSSNWSTECTACHFVKLHIWAVSVHMVCHFVQESLLTNQCCLPVDEIDTNVWPCPAVAAAKLTERFSDCFRVNACTPRQIALCQSCVMDTVASHDPQFWSAVHILHPDLCGKCWLIPVACLHAHIGQSCCFASCKPWLLYTATITIMWCKACIYWITETFSESLFGEFDTGMTVQIGFRILLFATSSSATIIIRCWVDQQTQIPHQ